MFLDVLAGKLADALPGLATVEYSGGRFGRRRRVERIGVAFGEQSFVLTTARSGVTAEVAHQVRGVRLSGRTVGLDEWLRLFSAELARYAASEGRGREALARLLG